MEKEEKIEKNEGEENNDDQEFIPSSGWIMLASAMGMIDLIQIPLVLTFLNSIIDPLVALFLFSYFFIIKGARSKKLLFSVLAGFGLGIFTAGAMPAWILDVGYAYLVTDGKKKNALIKNVADKIPTKTTG